MKTVYFVCTANICRSPMAAAILRSRLAELGLADQIRVESAGIHGRPGYAASDHAQAVMAQRGISLEDHRSQGITHQMLEDADIFLVMEESHRRSLFHLSPKYLSKVFLLSEMTGEHHDIEDPYGRSSSQYEETATLLEGLIDAGLPSILKRLGVPMREASQNPSTID